MAPTMGTPIRRARPTKSIARSGSPDLVRVGRRAATPTAIAGVVAAGLLLALAVWKPWEGSVAKPAGRHAGGHERSCRPDPGDPHGPRRRLAMPDVPLPAPAAPTFAGLDLSLIGTVDRHDCLGCRGRLRLAGRNSTSPPTGTQIVTPGRQLGGASSQLEAIAGSDSRPTGRHDRRDRRDMAERHPADRSSAADPAPVISLRTGAGAIHRPSPPAEVEVTLGDAAARRRRDRSQVPARCPASSVGLVLHRRPDCPSDVVAWPGLGWPASWPTHGWPAGAYVFEVDLAGDGSGRPPVRHRSRGHEVSRDFVRRSPGRLSLTRRRPHGSDSRRGDGHGRQDPEASPEAQEAEGAERLNPGRRRPVAGQVAQASAPRRSVRRRFSR